MKRFLVFLSAFRKVLLSIGIVLIIGLIITNQFHVLDSKKSEEQIAEVFIKRDEELQKLLEKKQAFIAPLEISHEEFQKTFLFE